LSTRDPTIILKIPMIQSIATALDNKQNLNKELVNRTVAAEFYQLNQKLFDLTLYHLILEYSNDLVSKSLCTYIKEELDVRDVINIICAAKIEPTTLACVARSWVIQQVVIELAIEKHYWRGLSKLAKKTGDIVLSFWTANKRGKYKLAQKYLEAMTIQEYSFSLKLYHVLISPREFVCPKYARVLISYVEESQQQCSPEEFYDLISDLVYVGQEEHLAPLSNKVYDLDEKTLACIEKRIRKKNQVSSEFREAVRQKRDEYGYRTIFWKKVFSWKKKGEKNTNRG
jgi:hypothetical protein